LTRGMARRDRKRRGYHCPDPPCIHVVYDERRRIYRVFIEESDNIVVSIPASKLESACNDLQWVKSRGFREADMAETDFLARRYLGARPEEEETGEYEE